MQKISACNKEMNPTKTDHIFKLISKNKTAVILWITFAISYCWEWSTKNLCIHHVKNLEYDAPINIIVQIVGFHTQEMSGLSCPC